MLRFLNNKRAQAPLGEYLLVLLLVATVITAMSLYFRRLLQAKIRDAGQAVFVTVNDYAGGYYNNLYDNLYYAYDPYYLNATTIREIDSERTTKIKGGGSTGVFTQSINETTKSQIKSITAPPVEAK